MRLVKEDCHCKRLEDCVKERACKLCLEVRLDGGVLATNAAPEPDAVRGRVVVEAF